jgi:hypothetical protein
MLYPKDRFIDNSNKKVRSGSINSIANVNTRASTNRSPSPINYDLNGRKNNTTISYTNNNNLRLPTEASIY